MDIITPVNMDCSAKIYVNEFNQGEKTPEKNEWVSSMLVILNQNLTGLESSHKKSLFNLHVKICVGTLLESFSFHKDCRAIPTNMTQPYIIIEHEAYWQTQSVGYQ